MTISSPTPPTGQAEAPIDFWPAQPLTPMRADWPNNRGRFIIPTRARGWHDFALSEWELQASAWEDFHPHDETNFVIEGELHIEADGTTVILRTGDAARVRGGRTGRYWAPDYARMVAVYGPNPEGLGSHSFKYRDL
ncbi:cupin domain-containing protein [Arthrobacter sp. I2-34]|uniref:Cupin domain-containing protein n=1 Tax=Arthrobacter hankyongi TaxID=2904801 RepID=A0ABS9LDL6_9MICC|nr:cupin domain-containing protein [Arthrobacter hankyongi]MCG2624792.1 cupin domain-containing protein [Arthrobacter hankyongi]